MKKPLIQSLNPKTKTRFSRYLIGSYRLGIIVLALLSIWLLPKSQEGLDKEVILREAKSVIISVDQLGDGKDGMIRLLDSNENLVGWAASTFPEAERVQGYSGPSELLVVFDPQRTVKGVRFLLSRDTTGHVKKVRDASEFWEQWTGQSESSLGVISDTSIVSGATLTSEAMARGIAARFGAEGMDQWFPEKLKIDDVGKWFPEVSRMEDKGEGVYEVYGSKEKLGFVLRSSRMGVSARGFNGTSDVIVALELDGKTLLGVSMLNSRDNEPYVSDVKDEVKYTEGFKGKKIEEVLAEDSSASAMLFTSGASLTNYAVVESVHEMLRRYSKEAEGEPFQWKFSIACLWIGAGLVLGVSRRGSGKKVRFAFAAVSVFAGIWFGWMVGQDQLVGWGKNGFDMVKVLPLLVLTCVALIVPALTGKNVYCSRICPHGAAQTLLGNVVKKRFSLPPKVHGFLVRIPWLTLLVIWLLALVASGVPLAYFEPFETWSTGFVALIPAGIFTIGLVGALFLPQAYCHYGCPTGAMLKFLTAAPGRWTRRDTIAGVIVSGALIYAVIL
ncbi:MAG: FMN-binding protein [Akkermansiaceae bacterium]